MQIAGFAIIGIVTLVFLYIFIDSIREKDFRDSVLFGLLFFFLPVGIALNNFGVNSEVMKTAGIVTVILVLLPIFLILCKDIEEKNLGDGILAGVVIVLIVLGSVFVYIGVHHKATQVTKSHQIVNIVPDMTGK